MVIDAWTDEDTDAFEADNTLLGHLEEAQILLKAAMIVSWNIDRLNAKGHEIPASGLALVKCLRAMARTFVQETLDLRKEKGT